MSLQINTDRNPAGLHLTCVSLWWSSSQAVPVEDPWSVQPCPPIWACICLTDQRTAVCQSGEEEGSRIRQSSQPAAPSSASPCVSYLPRSFQPAPRQPQSFQGGWEVLEGVKQRWNGELISSSSYMSDCSQWTGYSWTNCAFSPYARV